MKRFGKLLYDEDIEHWRFEDRHGAWWVHSGDTVAFHLGDRYVQGRIEHTENWYVLLGDARLSLWHKGPMPSVWRNNFKQLRSLSIFWTGSFSATFARMGHEFQMTMTVGKRPTNNASSNNRVYKSSLKFAQYSPLIPNISERFYTIIRTLFRHSA